MVMDARGRCCSQKYHAHTLKHDTFFSRYPLSFQFIANLGTNGKEVLRLRKEHTYVVKGPENGIMANGKH